MIKLISFGYSHGLLPTAGAVFDCRILSNPHHVADLRRLDGRSEQVRDYVSRDPEFNWLIHRVRDAVKGDAKVIAFGCYGGRHRSVAMAEIVAERLRAEQHEVELQHTALTSLPGTN